MHETNKKDIYQCARCGAVSAEPMRPADDEPELPMRDYSGFMRGSCVETEMEVIAERQG